MAERIKYNFWMGVWKAVKNSAILLVPFFVAVLLGLDEKYAWAVSPVVYFLKNMYEVKTGNKLL